MTSLQADGTAVRGPDPEERVDALLRDLGTRLDGLGARGADRRLRQFGANEIRPLERPSRVRELARQLVDPLAPLLWMAVGFSLLQGTVLIVAVILINAGFSFVQELHAERATEALRAFLPRRARVRRDGAVAELDATQLVPGDIVLVSEGDRLSADARLLAARADPLPQPGAERDPPRAGPLGDPAPRLRRVPHGRQGVVARRPFRDGRRPGSHHAGRRRARPADAVVLSCDRAPARHD